MTDRFLLTGLLSSSLIVMSPAYAARNNCGSEPCGTTATVKGSSVIPDPNEFNARGDQFDSSFTDLRLVDGSARVDLRFDVNFGFGLVNTLFVNKNGIVSFGAPLRTASASGAAVYSSVASAQQVRSLADFNMPVIAPYFSDLALGTGAGDGTLQPGDITLQYGEADPYADGGAYRLGDLRSAVRITWYGLNAGRTATGAPQSVYTQLLISADNEGLSSFQFRYGTVDAPGQQDYGSIAGFALGNTLLQFAGPYQNGVPTFFEFEKGAYIGQGGTTINAAVPEPATWLQLIAGFGAVGFALRRRRRGLAAV